MWNVVTVEGFDSWFLSLSEPEQTDVLAYVKLLEVEGPNLGRPYVDSLTDVKQVKNLKELRVQHQGKPYRVFFAFVIPSARQCCCVVGIRQEINVSINE